MAARVVSANRQGTKRMATMRKNIRDIYNARSRVYKGYLSSVTNSLRNRPVFDGSERLIFIGPMKMAENTGGLCERNNLSNGCLLLVDFFLSTSS